MIRDHGMMIRDHGMMIRDYMNIFCIPFTKTESISRTRVYMVCIDRVTYISIVSFDELDESNAKRQNRSTKLEQLQ